VAPKEASIHFLLGKIYKKLGQPEKAMTGYMMALDLDPRQDSPLLPLLI